MSKSIDIIQDFLLVSVVILLVYVLYKRLLIVLGKKEKSKQYLILHEGIVWTNASAVLPLESLMEDRMSAAILDMQGNTVKTLPEMQIPLGKQQVEIPLSDLPEGKYEIRLTSRMQHQSIFFHYPISANA
ncbi:MAG: hypothetical protein ACKOZY_01075 [Flavobacteriales bacterium]